ncbi:MAG: leucine-rich repeat domain-containing protein [Clostridia bacterium]|nr:leucine-rich repeat domain-containing protein [Clostridia bacterium]
MKKTNKIILTVAIVAVLLLGIGYAAIQNITLNISGSAAADPSQSNFKVMFSGTPTVSDDTYVTASITDDTNATINVAGLTKKGDVVTATYTVQNASEDLSADLAVSTINSNTEYFTLISELDKSSLVAGEATTLTVTVKLTKTPIVDSVSTTIGVQLEAMPVQPGEEGTSEGTNDFSQTPDYRNEYGFYFDKLYVDEDNLFGFIAHEDGSVEDFKYTLAGELEGLTSDEWLYIHHYSAGEYDYAEMVEQGATVSNDGKRINLLGVDYVMSDYDVHGLYYGNEYSAVFVETYIDGEGNEYKDEFKHILTIQENGSAKIAVHYNGGLEEEEYIENLFEVMANGYFFEYDGQLQVMCSATGNVIYWSGFNSVFKLEEKHNYVSRTTKEATCTEDGEIKYSCTICNKSYTTIVRATNHENDDDNNGICDDCGDTIIYTDFEVDSYNRKDVGYSDSTTELVIQSTIYDKISRTWYKVTSISNSAFENCTNLTNVVIPEGVKSIGSDAFSSCTNLTNIALPTTISYISGYAFRSCTSLTELDIPESLEYIEGHSFSGCTGLTKITVDSNNPKYCSKDGVLYSKDMTTLVKYPNAKTDKIFEIPDSVNIIDGGAFKSCNNLTNVIIPNSVTDIGTYGFMDCINLTSVTIPGSVKWMSYDVFAYCINLKEVVILNGVKTIAEYIFSGCKNLTTAVIPASVTSIEYGAFGNCPKLTTVNYTGTKEQWNTIEIENYNSNLTNATINYNYVIPTE